MSTRHVIEQLVLALEFQSESRALAAQEALDPVLRNRLFAVIERVFNRHETVGGVRRIERLEVDLGRISLKTFDDELLRRLEIELDRALTQSLGSRVGAPSLEGDPPSPKTTALEREGWEEEILLHYLARGSLPWNASLTQAEITEIIARSVLSGSPALIDLLRSQGSNGAALSRLVAQTPRPVLEAFVRELHPESAAAILEEMRSAESRSRRRGTEGGDADTERDLWRRLLGVLLEDDPSARSVQALISQSTGESPRRAGVSPGLPRAGSR